MGCHQLLYVETYPLDPGRARSLKPFHSCFVFVGRQILVCTSPCCKPIHPFCPRCIACLFCASLQRAPILHGCGVHSGHSCCCQIGCVEHIEAPLQNFEITEDLSFC